MQTKVMFSFFDDDMIYFVSTFSIKCYYKRVSQGSLVVWYLDYFNAIF